MRKYIYLFALLILFGGFAFADDGGYNITSYSVNMDLHTDASMDVAEKIDVNFLLPRHGIYRQIPVVDPIGDYLQIENFDSDQPIASEDISNGNYELKLGSADKTITGPQPYNITYTVKNAIKAYAGSGTQTGRSELYRNVVGNDRKVAIGKLDFRISIPSGHTFANDDMYLVYGYKGDRLTDDAKIYQSGNYIYGNIDRELYSTMGATVSLRFPAEYFQVAQEYSNSFTTPIADKNGVSRWFYLPFIIFGIVFFTILIVGITNAGSSDKSPRKSDKSVTIYYKPPANISPSKAFWFWFDSQNPKIFTAILYYRCTKGRAKISKIEGEKGRFGIRSKDTYHITETSTRPAGTDSVDDALLQGFFGDFNEIKDSIAMNSDSYLNIGDLLSQLEEIFDIENIYYTKKINIFSLFGGGKAELTEEGKKLFEELRGYKEYLTKVEKPVLESELKADPDFFNKTLPWVVLFGVSTKLLEAAEDILAKADWYDSYDNKPLTPYVFNSMNNSIKTFSIAPRSDSSGSSFGSSGGGSSGGGGGGGGGGSW